MTNAGYTSEIELCFAPNPPPILGFDTRIFDFGMHNALDKILRTLRYCGGCPDVPEDI